MARSNACSRLTDARGFIGMAVLVIALAPIRLLAGVGDTLDMPAKHVIPASESGGRGMERLAFDTLELRNSAGTGNDVNRVLHLDVSSQGTGHVSDNSVSIRGSGRDENLYVINGIEFEGIDHFTLGSDGALSFISTNVLGRLDLYPGGGPREFATSPSVIVLRTRPGTAKGLMAQMDLEITGGEAVLEGPTIVVPGSFLAQARYFDARPLKPWITTGQTPRFFDGTLNMNWVRNIRSYTRLFGMATWDAMETQTQDEPWEQSDRYKRTALSLIHHYDTEGWSLEGGVSGLASAKDQEWVNDVPSGGFTGNPSIGQDEYSGRAFLKWTKRWSGRATLEAGGDAKLNYAVVEKNGTAGSTRRTLSLSRSGAFSEYSNAFGPYDMSMGARVEAYSAFGNYGISPRVALGRSLWRGATAEVSGVLNYMARGGAAEAIKLAYSDTVHPAYDLETLPLKRLWYSDVSLAQVLGRARLEVTAYSKFYDREFKSIDGIGRNYYGGSRQTDAGEKSVFLDPEGRRYVFGSELKLAYKLEERLRLTTGVGMQSIREEYVGGSFHPGSEDIPYSFKAACIWRLNRSHLISLSLIANQGRPFWTRQQALEDAIYSERMSVVVNLNVHYGFEKAFSRCRFSFYLEVDNALDQRPDVYQVLRADGSYRFLALNGVYPLIGTKIEF